MTYSSAVMSRLPAYHLITKQASTEDCTWFSQYQGDNYLWRGTFVYGGDVYDHIQYRARGGVWRYAMGKNMWKFNFLRGHSFRARDDFGREYATRWDKINFSAVIQQGDYQHRGEQGLFESAGFKLFNLSGVPASKTHFVTFRIVDEEDEYGETQYDGDFWGLYLVLEQMDGRFLDEHLLPDGNLYKIENYTGELNNQGPTAATDGSDLVTFQNTYEDTTPTDAWWRTNVDLGRYYGYRAILEAIHHYDNGYGKNYFYYLDPETNVWSALPWDLDLTWADTMFGNGDEPFRSRVLSRAAFSLEYKNRMREIRDLLYNTDQSYQLIDEFAAMIDDAAGGLSIVDVDRSRWDYNPIMANGSIVNLSKAGQGRFYQQAATKDFPGMAQIMRSYVTSRGTWIDTSIAADAAIPARPTVTSTSPAGYPIDELTFEASAFSDPQGPATFGAMKWRVAEVTPSGVAAFVPGSPRLFEINAVWESEEIAPYQSEIAIPPSAVNVGHTYRVRVRMKDTTGRWSKWSAAVEFKVGKPTNPLAQQEYLRVTEIMYHPPEGSDYEFIELKNTGPVTLDLSAIRLVQGIEFDFAQGDVQQLLPGEFVLIVKNRAAFGTLYDTTNLKIAGEYSDLLNNAGESLALIYGAGLTILSFAYDDGWFPTTDGGGSSLEIRDALGAPESWNQPTSWEASTEIGGTPGWDDGGGPASGYQRPGDSNQDNSLDLSDGVSILFHLFGGGTGQLPCAGDLTGPDGNLVLLDVDGSSEVDLTDAIYVLNYLFKEGAPPTRGTSCIFILGCPHACAQ